MECNEAKIKLTNDFINGKMRYYDFLDISKHLQECNGCTKEYEYLKRMDLSIKNLGSLKDQNKFKLVFSKMRLASEEFLVRSLYKGIKKTSDIGRRVLYVPSLKFLHFLSTKEINIKIKFFNKRTVYTSIAGVSLVAFIIVILNNRFILFQNKEDMLNKKTIGDKSQIRTVNKINQAKIVFSSKKNQSKDNKEVQNIKKTASEKKPLKYSNKKGLNINYKELSSEKQLNQFEKNETLNDKQKHVIFVDVKF